MRADHAEDLALDLLVLRGRLDDEVAIAEGDEVGRAGDARQGGGGGILLEGLAFDQLAEVDAHSLDPGVGLGLGDWSLSSTSMPASAQTCAMPVPIWPAPITPIFAMSIDFACLERRPAARTCEKMRSAASLGQRGGEFRNDGEEIADEAVVGDLEDRRLFVLVDRDDDLGILHAGQMLNGT